MIISKIWNRVENWMLPEKVKTSFYLIDKARVLAVVHLLLIIIMGVSVILSLYLTPENQINKWTVLVLSIALPLIFKVFGNLNLSGNLLALGFAIILLPMIFTSGGLFSDNLIWLMMCPVVVMLFSNKKMLFLWLFGLLALTTYLYLRHTQLNQEVKHHHPLYYFISVSLLFTVVVLVIYFFKMGEDHIIQDLQNSKMHLERRQRELTATNIQLRQISEQLRSSNRDLESFAYAASHDLKEPLRMIGSYTSLLERRLRGQLSEDNLEMMAFVQQGVKQMQRLLDDILEYSRVGRGQDKIKMVDLDDVLYYIKNSLKLRIEETQAEIIVPVPLPSVFVRYSEMVQLFQNLIANAIKFRKKGVAPVITITWKMTEDFVHIFLADNGIGIEKSYQNRVFDLFERLHSRQDYDGSGIGLATCKKIVENYGGTIDLESEYGVGTVFHFTLPQSLEAFECASRHLGEPSADPATLSQKVN